MGAIIGGDAGWINLYQDKSGRTYIKGLWDTRKKLMEMGMERNEFERLIKESAIIAARYATQMAPVRSGRLAASIRGQASKSMTFTRAASGIAGALGITESVTKRAFGGVILGKTPYARATSYGMHHVAGQPAKENKSERGYAKRVWRTTVRGSGNSYMVKGREAAKPAIVNSWNNKIRAWIHRKGFQTGI